MSTKNVRRDPAWKYGKEIEVPKTGEKKGYKYIRCNFCSKEIKGGVKRMKDHLAGTHKDVAACLKVPDEVKEEMSEYLKTFQENKHVAQRNFQENVGSGAYYAGSSTSANDRGVRGPMDRHVVSEGGSLPTETRTPVSAHCIDLMLEKIGDLTQHKNALIKAKKVSNFIYNHQWVLSLARKYLKKDLLRPAATRFATAFLTIQSVYESKEALQQMFVSTEWGTCAWAKKDDGKQVKKIIMDERTFWPSVVYCIKITMPLVEVLRIVDGERTPAMGYLYGAMDECKEKIAKNLGGDPSSYKEIWDIIDQKWDHQMHRDLHAAAYYLNPRYRWSPDVSTHPEIKRGLYDVMQKLVKENDVYMKIDNQLISYNEKKGLFGYRASLATYQSRAPVHWWEQYGDDTPELKAFAMKILGLTCSASACERNWSTFNQVHTKRRNRLTTGRLNNLVYIMYNRRLKQKFLKKSNLKEEDDPLVVEDVLSDDEWLADPNDDEDEGNIEGGGTSDGGNSGVTRERGESSSSRKRKLVLIDEDDDDEVPVVDEDEENDDGDPTYVI